MSEPGRLRDDGPDEVRELLRAGARTRGQTPDEKRRTGARVARYASAAAMAAALSWVPGAALGAGLGVAAIAVVWGVPALHPSTSPAPETAPVTVPLPVIGVTAAPAPTAAPTVETAREPPPAPSEAPTTERPAPRSPIMAAPSVTASAAPPVDRLAGEVALIQEARAALMRSSPGEALSLTDQHASRYPAGVLTLEREMVAIDALRALGRAGEARSRGEAILGRVKGSPYELRIRNLLEGAR